MGVTQFLIRLPRLLPNACSLPEIRPLHTSTFSKFHIKSQHFIGISPYLTENPSWCLPNGVRGQPFRLGVAVPSLHRSLHASSMKVQISNEVEEDSPQALSDQINERAREVCKLISTCPKSLDIETALGSSVAQVQVSPLLVLEVLRRLNNAAGLALGFFRWAEKQRGFRYTTESYNALVDSLGRMRQFLMVWNVVESMREKGLLTKDTLMIIVRRYSKAGMASDAVVTFDRMEMFGLKPDLSDFNSFLHTLNYSGQIKKAQQVFDEMKKRRFSPDQKTYAILLEGWGKEQDLSMVEAVFREMRNEGLEADAVTYGVLINAYCKAGEADKAIEIFHNVSNPTPRMYCILINALGSNKRLIEALHFFKMSRENLDSPEAHIYNAVVRSYCSVLRFDDAYWVVDEMRRLGIGPNSRTYDIILHHLVKARRTKEAYAFFQRIKEQDSGPTVNTYEIVVRMFCHQDKLDKAIEIWNQMKDKGILPNLQMFSILICSLCRERELTEACKYFQDMLDMGIVPPGQLFSILKHYLLECGKKDIAFVFTQRLEKMRKARLVG